MEAMSQGWIAVMQTHPELVQTMMTPLLGSISDRIAHNTVPGGMSRKHSASVHVGGAVGPSRMTSASRSTA